MMVVPRPKDSAPIAFRSWNVKGVSKPWIYGRTIPQWYSLGSVWRRKKFWVWYKGLRLGCVVAVAIHFMQSASLCAALQTLLSVKIVRTMRREFLGLRSV